MRTPSDCLPVTSQANPELTESTDELLALADLTLADYLRYLAAYGGAVEERDGLLLFAGAHRQPNPYRNGALRLDDSLPADEVLARAGAFFAEHKRGYALWAREHGDAVLDAAAKSAGYRELERIPELMMGELAPYLPPPEGVEIRRIESAADREAYLALVANAWGAADLPRPIAAQLFFDPDSIDVPNVVAYIAEYEGVPISAGMSYVSHGVALGCQAATIRRPAPGQRLPRPGPQGESRGLAGSCVYAALDRSFVELGAKLSLAQTSSLGLPTWLDLGYRPFSSYARYVVPITLAGRS
jgi:hypothetical protein